MNVDAPQGGAERAHTWDAFLSYSSSDADTVGRVQRFLERYPLPDGRRLRVYRDETDIEGGDLPEQLRAAIADSACLLVCCSEQAAASHWVATEIEAFAEAGPGRPVMPLLVAERVPDNLPLGVRDDELRRADLTPGWALGRPRASTREELVRVVAKVSGIPFRELLPLDKRRRRGALLRRAGGTVAALFASAWIPVVSWTDVTPDGRIVAGCDMLDSGLAHYRMNPPQAIKNIVTVHPGLDDSDGDALTAESMRPRGRLLPGRIGRAVFNDCPPWAWVGEPQLGMCVGVMRSDEEGDFGDFMGGGSAPLTEVRVGAGSFVLDAFWQQEELPDWEEAYGRTMGPSQGIPISASGPDVWLGFGDGPFTRGLLWHTRDAGREWSQVPGITDIRSVRQVDSTLVVAGRVDAELGFFTYSDSVFTPLDTPGKGDDLEICGEQDGRLVIRADRSLFMRDRSPWWSARLARSGSD